VTGNRPLVAVIGGGYGGIFASRALDDKADVVLIEPREAFQHNVAALRALVAPDWVERIFLPYDRLLRNGRVVRDHAVEVSPGRVRLASGGELRPDYIVLATGSAYPFPAKALETDRSEAVARYRAAHKALADAPRVMLLGAGAVGVELAGEIAAAWPDKQIVLVDAGDDILPGPFDPRVRAQAHRHLDELGVRRVLGSPLSALPQTAAGEPGSFTVTSQAGQTVEADLWFQCFGVAPVTDYLAGDLAAARRDDGFLDVTPELLVRGTSTVYAIGDVIAVDPYHRAGAAARHAGVAAANVEAAIAGSPQRQQYAPSPPVLILPIGPERGAGQLPGHDDVMSDEEVAQMKGHDLLVDRYAELLGR
jgi:NADH dehydrogenase FAD-containing subunit